jgi:predicted DNA-binding transcriptional regulator YafY
MRKIDRLFEIIQLLRGHRLRTAEYIAKHLGISTRTVYRDIQALMASGLPVEGERGVGYVIRGEITLPPLPFTLEEAQAVSIGLRLVSSMTDKNLRKAAQEARIKVNAVIPNKTTEGGIHVYVPVGGQNQHDIFSTLHRAVDGRQICRLCYTSATDDITTREIYPLALEYWGHVWTLAAWCLLRNSFRAFRLDRIQGLSALPEKFRLATHQSYQAYKDSVSKYAAGRF